MKTMDRILRSIKNIPAFPATAQKVAAVMGNPDYSITHVVNIIKFDASITANILRIANSAYFGVRRISSLHDAVVFLGQENIVRAIQVSGISKYFKKASGYGLNGPELWRHSVGVALMTQIISRKISGREDTKLFTAGLLHDIGKVILGEFVDDSIRRINGLVNDHGYSFIRAEEEVLGMNHAEVGGKMAQQWNFPQDIRDSITYHHRPDLMEKGENLFCWIIYLADQVCLMAGVGGGADGLAYWGLKDVIEILKIRQKDVEMGIIELLKDLESAKELIEII
ncbi:MAG: HDOD domain-containing protein [Syntrophales bacterium]|nr:HDOD domain-containing protein [Syntrophales bacterium]MDD5231883.1 HDOD domain-containing protein [Syntrophales bacterium]HPL63820.1 HDOD domain-containing protein [Syntrophales bacterium]